jgi:hypothetical protein
MLEDCTRKKDNIVDRSEIVQALNPRSPKGLKRASSYETSKSASPPKAGVAKCMGLSNFQFVLRAGLGRAHAVNFGPGV